MTGRHEFVPKSRFQTDGEDFSPHDYANQRRLNHEANLAGRTATPGEHKGERATTVPIQKARAFGSNVVNKLRTPTIIQH